MSSLSLLAPLQGWSAPLEEVPDAVFAARMLGDGVAIDPTGATLHAPCDATVVSIAAQKHAMTLRAANGAEILLHVGIDTVALAGEGFELHVKAGATVTAGAALLSFDLDRLARRAKSLMTPVIVTDNERFQIARRTQGCWVDIGDLLFELRSVAPARSTTVESGEEAIKQVIVPLEHGIHARPAALLASRVKSFSATVSLEADGRNADARSPMAMMSLGIRKGDAVTIRARGTDASAAVTALAAAILDFVEAEGAPTTRQDARPRTQNSQELRGVVACRGLAAGRATHLAAPEIQVRETGAGMQLEQAALERARAKVKVRLEELQRNGRGPQREIISAHCEFLDDPQLDAQAQSWLEKNKSAGFAWRAAIRANIDALRALGDARLAERADDLLDLESQVLMALAGDTVSAPQSALPERAIVLARELLPSQLAALDAQRLAGVCVSTGGPTSHVAILAAAMDIPTIVAMGPAILDIATDTPLVIDANEGILFIDPEPAQVNAAEQTTIARRKRQAAETAAAQRAARTADGVRVEVFANVGSVADAKIAVANGAEGCGLLRTEFLFLDRQSAPDEAEQARHYQQMADIFAGRPLVIRTLDIGGDKPVPYLQMPREENPALGLRGIRVSLWQPGLLREQLRALLRIRGSAQPRILLPMITEASEIQAVRAILETLCKELGEVAVIPLGAMIETPAAAINAQQIAREADFLSIGTNDLAQYTLAIDRGHRELAARLDARHPAVLRLIAMTVAAAHAKGKTVAVCGGLASDPTAVPILIGLGVRELSAVPAVIPHIKSVVGSLRIQACETLAADALER